MWFFDSFMGKWFKAFHIIYIFAVRMDDFSLVLGRALLTAAAENGAACSADGCMAWGRTGAMYLAHVLCGLPVSTLRQQQYATREEYGPIVMDCRWYDRMCDICLDGGGGCTVRLTGPDGHLHDCLLARALFLEMLDFCREG